MTKHRVRRSPGLLAASLSATVWQAALAQSVNGNPDLGQIPEVTVTAQRQVSLESRTPVAMSVLSGEQLDQAGLDNPASLGARLPNVHLDGAADGLKITIRGITNADATDKGDPSAAFMLDGIYIARPQNQGLSFYDLERVEVLRGPQGTLYGRNTTAGVVNVISRAPTRVLEGEVATELGNYGSRKATAMLNVPVNDALALRAALAYHRHDSYLINRQGTGHTLGLDRDDLSVRLSARLALGRDATLLLRYDHSTVRDSDDNTVPDTNFYTGVSDGKPRWYGDSTEQRLSNRFVPFNTRPEQGYSHKTTSGLAAQLDWNLGPATLSYLGSHRDYAHDMLVNYYYRVAPKVAIGVHENFDGDYRQDSHELRIATSGGGPLAAQAGLYYFDEQSRTYYVFRDLQVIGLPPYYAFPTDPTKARSKAAFGQATYSVLPSLRLTAGARTTHDEKSRVGSTNLQAGPVYNPATDTRLLNDAALRSHQATWRLGADYDLAPSTLLYGALATGYKAGGFNDGCLAGPGRNGIACPAALAVSPATLYYQPEKLRSYEAGLKTRLWGNRASLNLALFNYDYTNLQLSGVAIVHGAPRFVTQNAGVASIKGLELDGRVNLTPLDRIQYGYTLLDAHYVAYTPDGVHSWAGEKLDRAPAYTATLGYERRIPLAQGQLRAGIATRASAAYTIAVPSQLLRYRVPRRTESDASLAWEPAGARWSVLARVKNLEDKVQPITIDSFGMVVPSDPRTWQVRVDYRF
jgi:iron complex outermembrane receptor protein